MQSTERSRNVVENIRYTNENRNEQRTLLAFIHFQLSLPSSSTNLLLVRNPCPLDFLLRHEPKERDTENEGRHNWHSRGGVVVYLTARSGRLGRCSRPQLRQSTI